MHRFHPLAHILEGLAGKELIPPTGYLFHQELAQLSHVNHFLLQVPVLLHVVHLHPIILLMIYVENLHPMLPHLTVC